MASFFQLSSVLLSFSSNFIQFRPVSPSFAQFCLVFSSFLQLTFTKFSSILLSFRPISSSFNLRLVSPSFIQFCPILSSFRKCRSAILSRSSQIISVFYFYINVFPFILFYILFCSISFFLHNFARFLPRNFSFLFLRLFSLMFRAQLPHDIKSFFGLKFKPKKESNYEIIFYSRCSNVTQCCTSI